MSAGRRPVAWSRAGSGYDDARPYRRERSVLTEVTGIDHIYVTVSDLARSEPFYDRVLRDALGFRKNAFSLAGDPHIQYFNRL